MTVNAEDREWVAEGYAFWVGQALKHPRKASVQEQLAAFTVWAKQLGLIR